MQRQMRPGRDARGGGARPSRILAGLLALALAGCSELAPFETATPDPVEKSITAGAPTGAQGTPTVTAVSVCYSRLTGSREQVRDIAKLECAAGSPPVLVEQRLDIKICPVLTPVRATFKCATPPAAGPPAGPPEAAH